jgi:alpha(1,3/1,4) fucosyltransferase
MAIRVGRPARDGEADIFIGFVGFHHAFNPTWNHVTLALRDEFPLVVAEIEKGETPDFLIFSVFDSPHREPRFDGCTKIYTCEENIRVPWAECHYAFSVDQISTDPNYVRLPIYVRFLRHLYDHTGQTLVKPSPYDVERILAGKTKFCNFVYSNGDAKERILFFEMLSKYKRVDSGGAVLNNLGYRVGDKISFLRDYKFTIAFENSRFPGYTSEKLVEPMVANSIPIYWGDREARVDFNPLSFIDANEFEGRDLRAHFAKVIERIEYLDSYDRAYLSMLSEPWFNDNIPNKYCQPDYLFGFMRHIFSNPKPRTLPSLKQVKAPVWTPPAAGNWSWTDRLKTRTTP